MAKTIEINGRRVRFPELDFNAVSDLSENGVDIMSPKSMAKKPIASARAIVAWVLDMDLEMAGKEIQAHIINGGDLAPIFEALNEQVEDSAFFKALAERERKSRLGIEDHKKKQKKTPKEDELDEVEFPEVTEE